MKVTHARSARSTNGWRASPNETQPAAFGGGENEEIAPSFNAFVYLGPPETVFQREA